MTPVGDRHEVERLLYAYAERIDLGDLDGVAALFRHATWRTSMRSDVLQGEEQVRRAYDGIVLYDGIPRTKHVITNVVVTVGTGVDVASSTCAFTVLQARSELPLQPVLAGRYHDEFVRDADGWRFDDRLIVPEFFGDLSNHMTR
jgi:3-phenylpropionate/cinnamic acid dioxygenase small subunit